MKRRRVIAEQKANADPAPVPENPPGQDTRPFEIPPAPNDNAEIFGEIKPADKAPEKPIIESKFPPDKYLYVNGKLARDRHGNEIMRPEAKGKPGRPATPVVPDRQYGETNPTCDMMADQMVGGYVIWMRTTFDYFAPPEAQEALTQQFAKYFYFRRCDLNLPPELTLVFAIAAFVMPAFSTEKGKKFLERFKFSPKGRDAPPASTNASSALPSPANKSIA